MSVLTLATFAGCGDDEPATQSPIPRPATVLGIAIDRPAIPDPLRADDRPSQLVARQVYEPLTARVEPPYGRAKARETLARGLRANGDETVWTIRLRGGVRFSDGALLNGRAVAMNARRWAAQEPPPLPGLAAADAPRTDYARLIFEKPVRDLPERLDDPRLGIVSPRAIQQRRRDRYRFYPAGAAGTGPFLIQQRSLARVALARNPSWWGAAAGLGPALSRVELVVEPDPAGRFGLLDSGEVEIADELGRVSGPERGELHADPLLNVVRVPRSMIGLERSVRGVSSTVKGTPLSSVWLTQVAQVGPPP